MSVPKLRFSGFAEKWNKKRLDSFLERVSNPVDVIKEQEYTQIGIRSHGKGIFHKEPINGLGLGNKRVFWVEPNAFVVNIVFAWERAIAVTTEAEKGMIASHRFPMYLPKNNLSNVHFLRYLFVTDKGQSYLELASPGGAGRNKTLGQSNFAELKIDLPSLEEQTKIASFLSAVDEKISQLTQKHALLSQYKQGMMQKLFSQQIRFKADDGSEFGEWDKVTLGDCVDILTNGLSLDQNTNGNGFKVTRIETISNFNIDLSRVGYIDTQSDISSYKLVIGDILFSNINSLSHIGKVVYVDKDYDIYHGMNLLRIQFKRNLDKKFMFYQLSQKKFKQHFESIANKAVNQASINQTALKKTELCTPCLKEQTQIANFLFAIDQKIEVVAQQIEQAEQWKKGLLQQMFV